jgi:hypothetical protein
VQIAIRVFDADLLTSDDIMGTFVVGLWEVYCQPSHEVYQQTAALLGVTNSEVRGYVKLTVTVVAPGEQAVARNIGDSGPAPKYTIEFLPEHIQVKQRKLCVHVYWAEALPLVDESTFGGNADTDLYVRVDHGESTVCTKAVRKEKQIKGGPPLTSPFPVWKLMTTLTLPISEPSVMRHVCLSVWDYDHMKPDDLLGVLN